MIDVGKNDCIRINNANININRHTQEKNNDLMKILI